VKYYIIIIYSIIMRLLSSVTKKALLAFGYPRLNIDPTISTDNIDANNPSSFPKLYNVGAAKLHMSIDIPACQFFYPAAATADDNENEKKKKNENEKNANFRPYFRKKAVIGMIEYLNGYGDGLLQMLEEKSHPCQKYYGCNPIELNNENKDSSNKFPLILFSHGLGGNMELYTELCAMIASYGYIVVAIEHEDGSASYAASASDAAKAKAKANAKASKLTDDNNNKDQNQISKIVEIFPIPYKRPLSNAKVPYSRQKVLDMRTSMLEQRVNEIQKIYEYMATTTTTTTTTTNENIPSSDELSLFEKIISVTNTDELHLIGHSFGGATQLLAAQKWSSTSTMTSMASSSSSSSSKEAVVEMESKSSSATTTIGSNNSADNNSSGGGIATAVTPATTTTAATTVVTNTVSTENIKIPIPPIPKSIMVLDAWCYALSDEVLNNGINYNGISSATVVGGGGVDGDDEQQQQSLSSSPTLNPKIISILSQDWALTNNERKQTLQFLKNCNNNEDNNNVYSYYAKDSVHQSFSDTECWLPTYIARKMFSSRGMKEDRHITIRSCVKEFIQQQTTQTQNGDDNNNDNDNDNNILIPFPYK
jgi:hypothetical protein